MKTSIAADAREQLERVLANHRAKTGRQATTTELLRWSATYRQIADALEDRALAKSPKPATFDEFEGIEPVIARQDVRRRRGRPRRVAVGEEA